MNKDELEILLSDLDKELVKEFPDAKKIECLVVGGACLLFTNITTRPTKDIDVIITDLLGVGQESLAVNVTKLGYKVRTIIKRIGRRHGLKGDDSLFLNDNCAPFLIEMGDLPQVVLWRAYQKLHLFIPADLSYILACKLAAARADKDYGDIKKLRTLLGISTRAQAEEIVDRFFKNRVFLENMCEISRNLDEIFGEGE